MDIIYSEAVIDDRYITRAENAVSLLQCIGALTQTSERLRHAVLLSLSSNELSESLHRLSGITLPSPESGALASHLAICPMFIVQTKLILYHKVSALYLKAVLQTSQHEICLNLSTLPLAKNLVDKITSTSNSIPKCDYYQVRQQSLKNPVLASNCKDTLSVKLSSRGWRESLAMKMSSSASTQIQMLIQAVEDVCKDLELRCDNAEQPFREAQAKSCDLAKKLKMSEEKLTEIESEVKDRDSALELLQNEKSHLIEDAEQRFSRLSAAHNLLLTELDRIREKAVSDIENAHESARLAELAHLAIVTGKDEMYDIQSLKLAEVQNHTVVLEKELSQSHSECKMLREQNEDLVDQMSQKNTELEALKTATASSHLEIKRLGDLELASIAERQGMYTKVSKTLSSNYRYAADFVQLSELDERLESLNSELKAKSAAHENEISSLLQKHKTSLDTQNTEVNI